MITWFEMGNLHTKLEAKGSIVTVVYMHDNKFMSETMTSR